jgi:hypothetical protein
MVGGPACNKGKAEGIFIKICLADRYAVNLTRGRVKLGRPTPDPTAGHVRMRPGGGHVRAGGTRRRTAADSSELARIGALGHDITHGLHLHEASKMANLNRSIWGWFGRR